MKKSVMKYLYTEKITGFWKFSIYSTIPQVRGDLVIEVVSKDFNFSKEYNNEMILGGKVIPLILLKLVEEISSYYMVKLDILLKMFFQKGNKIAIYRGNEKYGLLIDILDFLEYESKIEIEKQVKRGEEPEKTIFRVTLR